MIIVYIRAIILYIVIIVAIRLMGKRQIGELQPSELAITILISNMATLPIEDSNIPMLVGAVPIAALVGFEILMSKISLKSIRFRRFVSGNPIVIIREGEIDQKQMKKLRFSIDDLMEALRENGIFDIKDVYYAIVETTGQVTVMQKSEKLPATPETLNLKAEEQSPPAVVISNGKIINKALNAYELTPEWIEKTVKKNKTSVKNVFLMTVNKKREYYIVKDENEKNA